MSKYRYLTVLLALSLALCLSSCFKDEPLNAECDIEQAYLRAGEHLGSWFLFDSDTLRNVQSDQTTIEFTMSGQADLTRLAPYFRISPGATISPASGSVHDFSQGAVEYTVTSEDGQWTRTYLVSIKKMIEFGSAHDFDFEHCHLDKGFYVWTEPWQDQDGQITQEPLWATGNPGYKISNSSTAPENYPTAPTEAGHEGKGVRLMTCRTSGLADMVQKPIAAGNLFIGQFDPSDALRDAMSATKFGRPFSFDTPPKVFTGWYKYKAGPQFTDRFMNVLEQRDYGTIYAVLYDNHNAKGEAICLYGDNVQTSDRVVAPASTISTTRRSGLPSRSISSIARPWTLRNSGREAIAWPSSARRARAAPSLWGPSAARCGWTSLGWSANSDYFRIDYLGNPPFGKPTIWGTHYK